MFVSASEAGALSGLATDRGVTQTKVIEQVGDGGYRGQGDDWDSYSEHNFQIVVNHNFMIGADRRSRMGVNNEDDEEPLVTVADTDPNQPLEEQQLWGEDGLQAVDGDGKYGGEAGMGECRYRFSV